MTEATRIIEGMAGRLVSPIVVGRETEVATVVASIDAALAGRTTTLLIAGEAGVGKSRLVGEAMHAADARGMRILRGACVNIGASGVPYGPIVEILRELHRELDEATAAEVVGHAGPDLARLVPTLVPPGEVPEAALPVQSQWLQARLLEALLGVIRRLAAREPILVVIEDLHWADPGTRETLTYLIRNLRGERIAMLLTYRSDELHRRHPLLPWLAEIERTGRAERIDLHRLQASQTRDLIAAIRGGAVSRELVERVVERSDGNPFFVEELVVAAAAGPDPRVMPPTLREILLARIGALPDAAHTIVGVAAVAGRRVDHDLLASVVGQDETWTLDALREAVGQQILVADLSGASEGYAFRHALMQEAAYDDLLPGERRRLHRAFAEAVAARLSGGGAVAAGHWAELAHHWTAARDDQRALDASMRAALAAVDAYAFADALRHYENVLELWTSVDDPDSLVGSDLASILDAASQVATLDGQGQRGVALREAAIAELGQDADPVRTALWHERLGRARWLAGDTAGALRTYEQAMAMAPVESPARARVQSGYGQILMLVDRWADSRDNLEQALELARADGDRQVEGHALNTLGLDLAVLGETEAGVAHLEEAHRIALEVGNIDDVGRASVNLVNALLYVGELDRAAEEARIGIAEDRDLGIISSYGAYLSQAASQVLFELGRWQEAAALAEEAFSFGHIEPHLDRYGLSRYVGLLVAAGDPTAGPRLDQLGRLLEGAPSEGQFWAPYCQARAERALWLGDPDEALVQVRKGLDAIRASTLSWYSMRLYRVAAWAIADLAERARARRDDRGAEASRAAWDEIDAVYRSFLPTVDARYHGAAEAEARAEAATIEAEVARIDGAPQVDAWREALALWTPRGRPYLVGYVQWRLGEALLVAGDRGAAGEALREANRIALELGAAPLQKEVDGLATRGRIDVAAAEAGGRHVAGAEVEPEPDDPFNLTPREREVLALVSVGRTNRQIAAELFISESTAGVHVSNILGKLGASTRTEAAGIAVRLGLGPSAVSAVE